MKTNKLFLIAALLGTALVACQKETEIQKPETGNVWTLKIQATKENGTRALDYSANTNTMSPYWKNGEQVDVYLGGDKLGTLTVTSADHSDPATLEGSILVESLSTDDELFLIFPGGEAAEWTYLGQDGSLPEAYDYATASLTVAALDAATHTITTTTDNAHFANQQSIYRFNFKVGGNAISVKSFLVASDEDQLVRSRTYDGGWFSIQGALFVNTTDATSPYLTSIRNDNASADRYTFTVVDNNNALYVGEKTLANGVVNGKFYNANIPVTQKVFTPGTGSVNSGDDVL